MTLTDQSEESEAGENLVQQFGLVMPLAADGSHVRPRPLFTSVKNRALTRSSSETVGPPLPQVFAVTTPLLEQGRSDYILAATDRLRIVIKCYASGGENYLHTHTEEDHTFVVLQGQATFRGPGGVMAVVGPNEGVLVPRGAYYSFQSSADEPLVLLRAGAPWEGNEVLNEHGSSRFTDSRDLEFLDPVVKEGSVYP